MKAVLLIETIIQAIGIAGVFVYFQHRAGLITIPPDLRQGMLILLQFLFFWFISLGVFGWVIILDEFNRTR